MSVAYIEATQLARPLSCGQYCLRRGSGCRRQPHDRHFILPKATRENRRRANHGSAKKIGERSDIGEVDECYTSCGKGGRGLAGKIAFAGAIERRGWRVRIEHIKSASRESLTSFIARNVRRGSIVHTDSFKSYLYVPKYGYKHCRVNHF